MNPEKYTAGADNALPTDSDTRSVNYEAMGEALNRIKTLDEVQEHTISAHEYHKKYQAEGQDLDKLYKGFPVTKGRENMKKSFMENKEHGSAAQLAELLPLLANKPGRLGQYCSANVDKTAQPDDIGAGFVDDIFELKLDRQYLADNGLEDVKPTVRFSVDVSSDPGAYTGKNNALRGNFLAIGSKAATLCYTDERMGKLGIELPKIVVYEGEDIISAVSETIKGTTTSTGNDSFMVKNSERFDQAYQEYFKELINSIYLNLDDCIDYLTDTKSPNEGQKALLREYTQIRDFLVAFEKTIGN